MSIDKQFLQLIFENASNFKFKNQSQRRLTNDTKQNNRNEFDNRDDKIKIFVVDEKMKSAKDFHNEKKHENYYIENDNLNYYNSNQKNETFVNFIAIIIVIKSSLFYCRRCKKTFTFNNELHRHLRINCNFNSSKKAKFLNNVEIYFVKNFNSFTIDVIKKINEFNQLNTITSVELIEIDVIDSDSTISSEFIIIRFNVDSSTDIDTKYEFRD